MKEMINRGFMRGVAMLMSIVMAGSITRCSKEAGSNESVGVSGSQGFADAEVAGSQEVANSESDNSQEIISNLNSTNDEGNDKTNDITDISSQTAAPVAKIDDNGKPITDFFDGKETDYGLKIDGKLVTNEAFADIMATKCSLKLLEKKENPDYDLYFRTLAKWNACFYTEDSLKEALLGTHLPAKERINYVLGQFDKFYETYDIDESSPYYIPESERLQAIF